MQYPPSGQPCAPAKSVEQCIYRRTLFLRSGISKLHLCERKIRGVRHTLVSRHVTPPGASVSSYLFLIIVHDVEYNFALGQLTVGNAGKPTQGNKCSLHGSLVLSLIFRSKMHLCFTFNRRRQAQLCEQFQKLIFLFFPTLS